MAELTILIPLHAARPWIKIVSDNLALLPASCRVIISDQTLVDDAIEELETRHSANRQILFIKQKGAPGWREHINYLLPKVKSRYFSILPQDDSITSGYYQSLLDAFNQNSRAAVTFAQIVAHNIPGKSGETRFRAIPKLPSGRPLWEDAIDLESTWNLGIPYRGVIRTRLARKILPTRQDRFADQMWVFGLALRGQLVEVPTTLYHKRYHSESAHSSWKPLTKEERLEYLTREVRRCFPVKFWLRKKIIERLNEQLGTA